MGKENIKCTPEGQHTCTMMPWRVQAKTAYIHTFIHGPSIIRCSDAETFEKAYDMNEQRGFYEVNDARRIWTEI
jgi:hypothetical protein